MMNETNWTEKQTNKQDKKPLGEPRCSPPQSVYWGWLTVAFSKQTIGVWEQLGAPACCVCLDLKMLCLWFPITVVQLRATEQAALLLSKPLPVSLLSVCESVSVWKLPSAHGHTCPGLASACFGCLWGTGRNGKWVSALSGITCYVAPIVSWVITERLWGTHAQTHHFTLLSLFKCPYFNGKFHLFCFLGTQIKTRKTKHKTHMISGNNFRHGLFFHMA